MTSTDVGAVSTTGQSLQSDDGGSTYYAQDTTNKGSVPACYASGTRILTDHGSKLVEELRVGDLLVTINCGAQPVRWIWSGDQPIDRAELHQAPVLISKHALGFGKPNRDLIVSGQHRIAVGVPRQLDHIFPEPVFVPAKAFCRLPGVRYMAGKRTTRWYHILCDRHCILEANNVQSESLLLGAQTARGFTASERLAVKVAVGRRAFGRDLHRAALPTLTKCRAEQVLVERFGTQYKKVS